MGNCSHCIPFSEPEYSEEDTIKISSDTIIGKYTQVSLLSPRCCYSYKSCSNQNLLDNIQLTKKQKKIFEKKISKSKAKTNKIKKNSIDTRNKLYLLT